jgi:hypothetical protein
MTARFARLRNGGERGILLTLEDGLMLRDRRWMRFHLLNVPLRGREAGVVRRSITDRADRTTLPTLINVAEGHTLLDGLTRTATGAALAQRFAQVGLTLLAPWLALALAIPPRRAQSGMGLGIGTIVLVGAVESGNTLAASAPWAQAALFAGLTILVGGLSLWQRRAGYDVVERQLNGLVLRLPRPSPRANDPCYDRKTQPAARRDFAA